MVYWNNFVVVFQLILTLCVVQTSYIGVCVQCSKPPLPSKTLYMGGWVQYSMQLPPPPPPARPCTCIRAGVYMQYSKTLPPPARPCTCIWVGACNTTRPCTWVGVYSTANYPLPPACLLPHSVRACTVQQITHFPLHVYCTLILDESVEIEITPQGTHPSMMTVDMCCTSIYTTATSCPPNMCAMISKHKEF